METILIEHNTLEMKIGKVYNNHINLIANFNIMNYFDLIKMIRGDEAVHEIVSIHNYNPGFGGMSLEVNRFFNHESFVKRLKSYLMEIYYEPA